MKKLYLLSLLSMLLAVGAQARAATLVADNAETGTMQNSLGGTWTTFNDGHSLVQFVMDDRNAYAGVYCRRVEVTLKPGVEYPYAGAATTLGSGATTNISAYRGIRFFAKGTGSFVMGISTTATNSEHNDYSATVTLTSSWKQYSIPFSSLEQYWGTPHVWDPKTAGAVVWTAQGSPDVPVRLSLDNIEFYQDSSSNVILPNPKVNQLGYLPWAKKTFTIATKSAKLGDGYKVIDSQLNPVKTGTISTAAVDDSPSTGESVFRADFSSLNTPGTYHISINQRRSFYFKIGLDVYNGVFKDALRDFYIIRCGTSISDAKSGITHEACHTAPETIRGQSGMRDAKGGWHNAKDYGKWMHMHAISAAYMMWLYELRTKEMEHLRNDIPESNNKMSDLLDEARWGLLWMLKLQNKDGSVFAQSDCSPEVCFGDIEPASDPSVRHISFQGADAQTPSSISAAVFSAAMAQAARVFEKLDGGFAEVCRRAALSSYRWLKTHRGVGMVSPFYQDSVSWQEEEWAFAEIYRLTGDKEALQLFQSDIVLSGHELAATTWPTPQFFGYFSLWQELRTPLSLKSVINSRVRSLSDALIAKSNASGYRAARKSDEYIWGSNEEILHSASNLIMAHLMNLNAAYRDTALDQLSYILGNNSLDKSFVTKEGRSYASHPHHWTMAVYNALIPGWAAGGPNCHPDYVGGDPYVEEFIKKGTPPAKCWADVDDSWATNEGQTAENAALVFVAGYFYSPQ